MDSLQDYQGLLDDFAVGFVLVDPQWQVAFFNREAEKLTGLARADALGRPYREIFAVLPAAEGALFEDLLAAGQRVLRKRCRIVGKAGRSTPVDVRLVILRNRAGKLLGGVLSFLDDSARSALESTLKQAHTLDDLVGRDAAMAQILEMLPVVAASDASILVLGETGVGKGMVARAIHNISPRASGPFVKVNCAALPGHLLESELFGYRRGAFTDAKTNKPGRFQLAEGGTIFLDEIGELPRDVQSKLLQVLDEREFFALGSTRPVRVNVRVVASTNRDLARMVVEGTFREDLYYRLKVVEVVLPPLRERRGDLPLLVEHFTREWAARLGKEISGIDPATMGILLNYAYPGNVRELKNVLEHAVLLSRDTVLHRDDLPHYLFGGSAALAPAPRQSSRPVVAPLAAKEREALLETLMAQRWNMNQTAAALGITRSTLWRKLRRHGLGKPSRAR